MFLASHNARLSEVLSPGSSEDYDIAQGAGTSKWSGDAEALYVEQVLAQASGERLDQAKQTHLQVPSNLGVTVLVGDYVTYTPLDSTAAITRKVREVVAPPMVGVVRLFLWDVAEA